jgi:hypothetical protein
MNWIKRHKFLTAVIVLVVLAILGSLGGSDNDNTNNTDTPKTTSPAGVSSNNSGNHAAANDVVISTCTTGAYFPEVKVTITNHTSKRSNYSLEVTLLDSSGNKVGDGFAASNNVEAGQTAYVDVAATTTGAFSSCNIASVSRYAA